MHRNDHTNSTAKVSTPEPVITSGYGFSRTLRLPGRTRSARSPRGAMMVTPYPCASRDRKSTRLNSSHITSSYAVFCLKKKNKPKELSPLGIDYMSMQYNRRHEI